MVTVPRRTQERVPERPLPGVAPPPRVSEAAVGGGQEVQEVFAQARGAAQDAAVIFEQEKRKAQDSVVLGFESRLSIEATRVWTEAQKRRRGDAPNVANDMNAEYRDFFEKMSGEITDEEVKRQVTESFTRRSLKLNGSLQQYELKQFQADDVEKINAAQQSLAEEAIAHFDEDDYRQLVFDEHNKVLFAFAQRNGLGIDWFLNRLKIFESSVHLGNINQLLQRDQDLAAKDYLHLNRRDMLQKDIDRASPNIKEGSSRAISQRLTDKIMLQDTDEKPLGLEEALALARASSDDPSVKDMVQRRVRQRIRDRDIALRQEWSDTYQRLALKMDNLRGQGLAARDLVSPDIWNNPRRLPAEMRDALARRLQAPPENDSEAWISFVFDSRKNPESIANMNQAEFESKVWIKLNGPHRERALQQWAQFQDDNKKPGKPFQSLLTDPEIVIRALSQAGIAGIQRTDTKERILRDRKKGPAFVQWMDRIDRARGAFFGDHDRVPTDPELQTIVDDLIIPETLIDVPEGPDTAIKDLTAKQINGLKGENFDRVPQFAVERLVREARKLGTPIDVTLPFDRMRISRAWISRWRTGDAQRVRDILMGTK